MYSFQNQNNNINMNLDNEQIDINTQIKLIFQKISKLEDSNYNLSQLLNDEISQRQILEKHSTTSIDAFYGQLNILKNNYDKLENVMKENFFKKKEEFQSNNQKKDIKSKNNSEDIIKKEFEQYQKEFIKIDNLENKINSINKESKKNIKEINDKIDKFNTELKKLHQNVLSDKEKNNIKINEIDEELNLFITEKTQEWENFENHLLGQYEKFINFIQNKVEEYNEGIKKLSNLNGEDINLLKEKMNLFQEANNKLRIDIFKGINESQEFLEKKYNSIIALLNK